MGKSVTICDSLFLQYSKSLSLGEENVDVSPTYFEWERADAQTARFVTDSDLKDAKGEGQVALLIEPEGLHPENYQYVRDNPDKFDAVLVPHETSIPHAQWYPLGGSRIAFDKWRIYPKDKNISILLSEKNTMQGHTMRHEIVRRFGEFIDVYTNIPDKIRAYKDYRYSIVVESELRPGYFTEKFIDCLSVGTIPIYWGSTYSAFTNIAILFSNIDQLYSIIHGMRTKNVAEKSYESRIKAMRQMLPFCRTFSIAEDNIYLMYPELFE